MTDKEVSVDMNGLARTLLDDMNEVMESKSLHEQAYDDCDTCGKSWDYYGPQYTDALVKAQEQFTISLSAFIDARITSSRFVKPEDKST